MRSSALAACLLVLTAVAARAQDGGVDPEPADGGVVLPEPPPAPATQVAPAPAPTPTVFFKVDGGFEAPLDFPGRLAAGSQLAAGLDDSVAGEIIHPSNPAALAVGLRRTGGIIEGGSTSVALQFNPYLLLWGQAQLYDEVVMARERNLVSRLLQDAAITLALAPGTPFADGADDEEHATAAAGVSVDVLGNRSIYGKSYSQCLEDRTSEEGINALIAAKPFQPRAYAQRPDETEEARKQRLAADPAVAAYEAARLKIVEAVASRLDECTRKTAQTSHALFVSTGARWITPGPRPRPGETSVIQRAYAAATYEFFTPAGIELAIQLRQLGDRPQAGVPLEHFTDAGISARYASGLMSFSVEATTSVRGGGPSTVALSVEVPLGGDVSLTIGGSGRGTSVEHALRSVSPTLSIQLQDVPMLKKLVPDILPGQP